jgi:hypothetical protein
MKSLTFRFFNPVKLVSGNEALDSLSYELKQLNSMKPPMISSLMQLEEEKSLQRC